MADIEIKPIIYREASSNRDAAQPKRKWKFSLPSIDVDQEPIFCGWAAKNSYSAPKSSQGTVYVHYKKLDRRGQNFIDADYYPNARTSKMQCARHIRELLLSTIRYKNIEIPVNGKITACEIVYQNFSIKNLRIRCRVPFSVNLDGRIAYKDWTTKVPPQSEFDEDYNFNSGSLNKEEHFFAYHLIDQSHLSSSGNVLRKDGFDGSFIKVSSARIFFAWNTPEKINEKQVSEKSLWMLSY